MDKNLRIPDVKNLPDILPVFPLEGVLLLPCGNLPLNIFEPRYLSMIDTALSQQRMIGMVQPKQESAEKNNEALFSIGCAGKITEFKETDDGRYFINLKGISRFSLQEEINTNAPYRTFTPCWENFKSDLQTRNCLDLNRKHLKNLLEKYFHKEGMTCDWGAIENAHDDKLITCLSMICPFTPSEKQALLEARCCAARAKLFITMLEIAICDDKECCSHH